MGHVAYMGKVRNIYIIEVGKPVGRNLLGNLGVDWQDNIKVDLK
jgi:hypothetical protein